MRSTNLRNVDLNLLVALHALLEERNVTGAARRLYVSQPAMSRMKDRLQEMFHDELLVRTAKGYEPTSRALAIYARLQQLLPEIDLLFGQREFDPHKVKEVLRIETTDWGATVLVPKLTQVLAQQGPGIEVDILPRTAGFEHLEANEVDLVIAPETKLLEETLQKKSAHMRAEPLCKESMVCVVRAGHPLSKRRLSFDAWYEAKHLSLTPMLAGARHNSIVEEALARAGRRRDEMNVPVRTPYFAPVGPILEGTDYIATVPLQVARRLQTPRLRILDAPSPFRPFTYSQVWHARNDDNPVHAWMRELLRAAGAELK